MYTEQTADPLRQLVAETLEERYEGVTFSDEITDNILKKIAPNLRAQVEESVVEFIAELFSAATKKPTRKPRARKKAATKETVEIESGEEKKEITASVSSPEGEEKVAPTPPEMDSQASAEPTKPLL